MKNIDVRDAREDERGAIRDLTLAAYEQYGNSMPARAWEGYRGSIRQTLEEMKMDICIVAVQDHKIVGSVLLYPAKASAYEEKMAAGNVPEIRLLAVTPEARGQGIGRILMDECIRRVRSTGATLLGLHTMDMMQVAQRMYVGMGFVYTPELDVHPAPGLIVKGYLLHLGKI